MESNTTNFWQRNKLLIKGCIIGLLALLLLIPAGFVQDLIQEREQRQKEATEEINSKWAGRQNLAGPILVLPYIQSDNDSVGNKSKQKHFAYFLPDELTINSNVVPLKKYRGIYKVMLYTSEINLKGSFNHIMPEELNIDSNNILWEEAFIHFSISDMKGLNDKVKLNWNDREIILSPHSLQDQSFHDGMDGLLYLKSGDDLRNVYFSSTLNLSGSEQILFTPVGNSTTVSINSSWPDPSFTGDILPQSSTIKSNGFTASWTSLSQKRNFPQQWKDDAYGIYKYNPVQLDSNKNNISSTAFGADLFIPVNGYQKTMRSVKYAILCILLTFSAFFLIETINKRSVHPFQYALIGLALILFYTLLLSFSEYTGFNIAYVIATAATIGLIAWFIKGILKSGKFSTILSLVLVLVYSYVFTILQLQDYALLLGSIGLFIMLAIIMHYSRRIQW